MEKINPDDLDKEEIEKLKEKNNAREIIEDMDLEDEESVSEKLDL